MPLSTLHSTPGGFFVYLANSIRIQNHSPNLTATELRERLLREKVKAMRRGSNHALEQTEGS